MAKMPKTIAARPDSWPVKYRIATTKANDILMTLSIVPMFCFTVFPPFLRLIASLTRCVTPAKAGVQKSLKKSGFRLEFTPLLRRGLE